MTLTPLCEEETNPTVRKGILLLAYLMYIALGAMIFQALEKDFEVERRELAVDTKCDFLKNRSNMTQEDVEVFVQVRDEDLVIFRVMRLLSMQRSHLM